MSIVVDFAPEMETRLEYEARRRGVAPDVFIRQAVETVLPPDTASLAALDSAERERRQQELIKAMAASPMSGWDRLGEQLWEMMTPEEREAEEAGFEELMAALEENRRYPGEPAPVRHA